MDTADAAWMATDITCERLSRMNSESLNAHLASNGVVVVSTYTKHTQYTKKHAGWFFEDAKGNLCVKHGRGSVKLSVGESLLVGIRTGRFVVR